MAYRSVTDSAPAFSKVRRRHASVLRGLVTFFLFGSVGLPLVLILLFRFVPVPATPLMIAAGWTDGAVTHMWVPLNAISPNLVRAVIASEDAKFCAHHGFDWDAIDDAIAGNAAGERLRGASTISQQTAKNLFLSPSRTWLRKGLEAYLTVLIEALWPKRRIIETYLNVAEWGPRVFGVEAAAERNFHKSAAKLSPQEAARLATILPSPNRYRADVPGPYVQRQSQVVLARMGEVQRDSLDGCVFR